MILPRNIWVRLLQKYYTHSNTERRTYERTMKVNTLDSKHWSTLQVNFSRTCMLLLFIQSHLLHGSPLHLHLSTCLILDGLFRPAVWWWVSLPAVFKSHGSFNQLSSNDPFISCSHYLISDQMIFLIRIFYSVVIFQCHKLTTRVTLLCISPTSPHLPSWMIALSWPGLQHQPAWHHELEWL